MVTEVVDIVQHSWSLRLWTLYNTCVLASCDLFALCVRVCACVWVCVCVCVWRLQTFCKRPGLSEMGRHAINNLLLLLSLSRDFNCRSWMCVRACWQWILPALCSAGEEAGPILGGGGEGRRGGACSERLLQDAHSKERTRTVQWFATGRAGLGSWLLEFNVPSVAVVTSEGRCTSQRRV